MPHYVHLEKFRALFVSVEEVKQNKIMNKCMYEGAVQF